MEPGQQCFCDCRQWECAGSPPLFILAPCKDSATQRVYHNSGSGNEGVGPAAPQSSGFQGDLGVGLRPLQEHGGASACIFWGLPGAPRRRPLRWQPLHWRQLLARSRKHGDLRELHLWSFGCIRELSGQRKCGELRGLGLGFRV